MEGISEDKHRFRDLFACILCSKPPACLEFSEKLSYTSCFEFYWTSVFKLPLPLGQILIKILFGQSQKTSSGGHTHTQKDKQRKSKGELETKSRVLHKKEQNKAICSNMDESRD